MRKYRDYKVWFLSELAPSERIKYFCKTYSWNLLFLQFRFRCKQFLQFLLIYLLTHSTVVHHSVKRIVSFLLFFVLFLFFLCLSLSSFNFRSLFVQPGFVIVLPNFPSVFLLLLIEKNKFFINVGVVFFVLDQTLLSSSVVTLLIIIFVKVILLINVLNWIPVASSLVNAGYFVRVSLDNGLRYLLLRVLLGEIEIIISFLLLVYESSLFFQHLSLVFRSKPSFPESRGIHLAFSA